MRKLRRSVARAFLKKKWGNSIGQLKTNVGAKSQGRVERLVGLSVKFSPVGPDCPKEAA
jgi:hypothetical protein